MIYDREDAASWPDMGKERCIVCGNCNPNLHHMPPKGTGGGKAWEGCLLALCGSGTTGHHGMWHHGDIELRFMGNRWHWRDIRRGRHTDWRPCLSDEEWDEMDYTRRVM